MPEDQPETASGREPPAAGRAGELDVHAPADEMTPEILPATGPLRALLRLLGRAEQAVGIILVVVILVLVFAQVVQRYLPGGGVAWTGEIARFAMVWATFILSGYLVAHDGHITIKVVDYVLPARALGVIRLFGHALIAVASIAFVYATYDFMTHDRGQVTPAAGIPLAAIYALVAFGFASTALRAVVAIFVLDVRAIAGGAKVAS